MGGLQRPTLIDARAPQIEHLLLHNTLQTQIGRKLTNRPPKRVLTHPYRPEHTEHTELEPSYGTPHLRGGDTPPGDGDSAMEPIDSI